MKKPSKRDKKKTSTPGPLEQESRSDCDHTDSPVEFQLREEAVLKGKRVSFEETPVEIGADLNQENINFESLEKSASPSPTPPPLEEVQEEVKTRLTSPPPPPPEDPESEGSESSSPPKLGSPQEQVLEATTATEAATVPDPETGPEPVPIPETAPKQDIVSELTSAPQQEQEPEPESEGSPPSLAEAEVRSARINMAEQEPTNGVQPQAEGDAEAPVEVPKKNQKPKEPPVTFREFDVSVLLIKTCSFIKSAFSCNLNSTPRILKIW